MCFCLSYFYHHTDRIQSVSRETCSGGRPAGDAQVAVTVRCHDTAARGARQEAELDEIGFVHVFDSLDLFACDRCDRLNAGGTASEFMDEGAHNMTVGRLETQAVYFVELQRLQSDITGMTGRSLV